MHCPVNAIVRVTLGVASPVQEEKDELVRQLRETMEVEDANRKKIILKFKSRYSIFKSIHARCTLYFVCHRSIFYNSICS